MGVRRFVASLEVLLGRLSVAHLGLDLVNDVTDAWPRAGGIAGLQQDTIAGRTAEVAQRVSGAALEDVILFV